MDGLNNGLADEISRGFAKRGQLEELLRFAVARCREALDAEAVAVWLVDGDDELSCAGVTEPDRSEERRVGKECRL